MSGKHYCLVSVDCVAMKLIVNRTAFAGLADLEELPEEEYKLVKYLHQAVLLVADTAAGITVRIIDQ